MYRTTALPIRRAYTRWTKLARTPAILQQPSASRNGWDLQSGFESLVSPRKIDFSHIDGATIRTAEAQTGGVRSRNVAFSQNISRGRQHGDGALAMTSHVEIPVDVAFRRSFTRKLFVHFLSRSSLRDLKGPDIPLDTFLHRVRLSVRPDRVGSVAPCGISALRDLMQAASKRFLSVPRGESCSRSPPRAELRRRS